MEHYARLPQNRNWSATILCPLLFVSSSVELSVHHFIFNLHLNPNPWNKSINWALIFEQDYNFPVPLPLELQDSSCDVQIKWRGGHGNFDSLLFENMQWLPAIQMIHFYFPACHLLVWQPYFSLLNHLSSLCLGRPYYLFNLKSLLALFPRARMPFIYFCIFHDILKIRLSCTPSSHDLWPEYVFPMKILTTRCFKNVFSLTTVDLLRALRARVTLPPHSSTSQLQTLFLERHMGWDAVVSTMGYSAL